MTAVKARSIRPGRALAAAGLAVAVLAAAADAVERRAIVFEVPSGAESVWVEGSLSFPPGAVKLGANLRLAGAGVEVPSEIVETTSWFDASLMLVHLRFRGFKEAERRVWAEWGDEVESSHGRIPGASGPVVEFKVFDAASDIRVEGDVNVGTMVVRVEQHAGIYYYWYLLPIALILGFLIWRKVVLRRR